MRQAGLAALCLASRCSVWYCGALLRLWYVVVIVVSYYYVLVRIFHLGSWGGPLLFREPPELQSSMEHGGCGAPVPAVPLPIHSRHIGTTDSSVIDTAPRGEGRGSICRGGRVICQQFCLLPVGGNIRLESARPGVWVGTPIPTDCSTSSDRPSAVHPIVSPPRGLIAGSREWS